MVLEEISKFIKDLRKKHNLTQKDLADKLGVTYQAVSKWENGKNIPDIEILKEISNIFNVDIDSIIGNEKKKKSKKSKIMIGIILIIIIGLLFIAIAIKNTSSFEFKKISTTCDDFKITGSAAYNKKTSSIYISNVEFCGDDDEVYKSLECTLYEEYDNVKKNISTYDKKQNLSLKSYLKDVNLNVNNYSSICKKFKSSNFYIEINATSNDNKITTYKIPLSLEDNCK